MESMHISLEQQLHVLAKQACLGDAHAMDCFARLSLVLVKLVARERLHGNRLARWMDDSDIAQIVVFRACRRVTNTEQHAKVANWCAMLRRMTRNAIADQARIAARDLMCRQPRLDRQCVRGVPSRCWKIRPSRVGSMTPPKIFWLRSNRISPLDSCLSGNCAEAVALGQKSVFKWARTPKPYAFDSTPCSASSPPRANCVTSDSNHLHMLVIIGQHLSSVKVKLSPSVQLPKAKIVAGNFSCF